MNAPARWSRELSKRLPRDCLLCKGLWRHAREPVGHPETPLASMGSAGTRLDRQRLWKGIHDVSPFFTAYIDDAAGE